MHSKPHLITLRCTHPSPLGPAELQQLQTGYGLIALPLSIGSNFHRFGGHPNKRLAMPPARPVADRRHPVFQLGIRIQTQIGRLCHHDLALQNVAIFSRKLGAGPRQRVHVRQNGLEDHVNVLWFFTGNVLTCCVGRSST